MHKPFNLYKRTIKKASIYYTRFYTLDRLLHHAHVVSLQGDSYRMKDRLKVGVVDFE